MKAIRRLGTAIFLIAGIFSTAQISAQRSEHTFIVVNKTNVVINALYVTPHNAKDWGEDILGADTLAPNEDLGIILERRETAKLWDLRVEDEDGNFIEWDKLSLRDLYSVSLYYKNGNATAVFDEFVADVEGTWTGYYDDGTRSPYVWSIRQNGANLTITDAKGGKTRSRGTIKGSSVRALDFATQNGRLSADGTRITWSDKVVWIRQ
jgi:hypothetical protein